MFTFISQYKRLREILMDQKLAALGDAYVNFLYSLALSKKLGEPMGAKVKNRVLADALRRAGLRGFLPPRISRHKQADAAEALIVYAWTKNLLSVQDGMNILGQTKDVTEAFCCLLLKVKKRINLEDLTFR